MKLGCSLQEAFGETWQSSKKFGIAPMEAFQIRDPYGPYGNASAFGDVSQFSSDNVAAGGRTSVDTWDAQSPWSPQWGEIPKIMDRIESIEKDIKQKALTEQSLKIVAPPAAPVETFTGNKKESFTIMKGLCDYFNSGTVENILLFVMIFVFINNLMEIFT